MDLAGVRPIARASIDRSEYWQISATMAKTGSRSDPTHSATASADLLAQARAGDKSALSRLFRRQGLALAKWARGRLPPWARRFSDTADVVQDALIQTFRRIDKVEFRGEGKLQAYLHTAVINRIKDEVRRVTRRPIDALDEAEQQLPSPAPTPFDQVMDAENEATYKRALAMLTEDERALVVGRMELGYTYEQLAVMSRRPSAAAARMAVRRAVMKLAEYMSRA
jgi:RNA polymerase sigma-70 factor (ECF subfamily)